ncbi:MAG: hypothetical protein HQL55_16685 [Magnetococcales bacterium]|nr:hypothetical protein [Magnetococcales bacterium]
MEEDSQSAAQEGGGQPWKEGHFTLAGIWDVGGKEEKKQVNEEVAHPSSLRGVAVDFQPIDYYVITETKTATARMAVTVLFNWWSEPSPDREFFEISVWFNREGLPDSRTGERDRKIGQLIGGERES